MRTRQQNLDWLLSSAVLSAIGSMVPALHSLWPLISSIGLFRVVLGSLTSISLKKNPLFIILVRGSGEKMWQATETRYSIGHAQLVVEGVCFALYWLDSYPHFFLTILSYPKPWALDKLLNVKVSRSKTVKYQPQRVVELNQTISVKSFGTVTDT